VAFVLGAGSNVGQAVGRMFLSQGYKLALGSRSTESHKDDKADVLKVKLDVTDAASIQAAFKEVEEEFGAPPSVVVYNPGGFTPVPVKDDPLSVAADRFAHHMLYGTHVFDAAQLALKGFRALAPGPKTFIATGNISPFMEPSIGFVTIQPQKAIAALLVHLFHNAYAGEDVRFYYASEVQPDGDWVRRVNAEGHAIAYKQLLETKEILHWDQRFHADGTFHDKDSAET